MTIIMFSGVALLLLALLVLWIRREIRIAEREEKWAREWIEAEEEEEETHGQR